jgi:hypothetical protein
MRTPGEEETMRKLVVLTALALVALFALVGSSAVASHPSTGQVKASLDGFQEVPAVSTTGSGRFRASVDSDSIDFTLTYGDLEGTAAAAHIHFGQKSVNGGVIAFLCGGGTKPACPASGTFTGTIVATDITPDATAQAQGIAPGEFAEVLRALRAGALYVNVHTSKFGTGEIRGQIGHGFKAFRGKHKDKGNFDNGRGNDDD